MMYTVSRPQDMPAQSKTVWKLQSRLLAWPMGLAIAAVLLLVVGVCAVDPDSSSHIGLVVRLSSLPITRWIAPEWWGIWGFQGLYREHPIGILLLPLLLNKLGYPASQASFFANAIYQVLSLVVIQRFAAEVLPSMEARSLGWMLQLIPIAFTYRIRANHEQAVLLLFVLGIWAVEKSREDRRWYGLIILAAVGMLLVKGVFVGWVFIGGAAWLLTIRDSETSGGLTISSRDIRAGIGLVLALCFVVAVIVAYEYAYHAATHESFLEAYFSRQIATGPSESATSFVEWLRNVGFYTGRLLWFSFPGSVAAIVVLWRRRKLGESSSPRKRQAFLYCAGMALLYVLLFSLSNRRTDRYIFPAYYLFAACGMIAAIQQWGGLRRFAERWDRHQDWLTPLLWLTLFCVNMASGPAGLSRVQI